MTDKQTSAKAVKTLTMGAIAFMCLSVGIFGGTAAYCIAHNMLGPVMLMAGLVLFSYFLLSRSFGR